MSYIHTDLIRRSYRGEAAHRHVTAISQHHRIQASPGYRAAAGYVAAQLEAAGLEVAIRRYPADGLARFWTTPSFLEWECESATLHLLEAGAPGAPVRFRRHPHQPDPAQHPGRGRVRGDRTGRQGREGSGRLRWPGRARQAGADERAGRRAWPSWRSGSAARPASCSTAWRPAGAPSWICPTPGSTPRSGGRARPGPMPGALCSAHARAVRCAPGWPTGKPVRVAARIQQPVLSRQLRGRGRVASPARQSRPRSCW